MDTDLLSGELRYWIDRAERFETFKTLDWTLEMDKMRRQLANELFERHLTTLRIVNELLPKEEIDYLMRRYNSLDDDPADIECIVGLTWVRQALGVLERSAAIDKAFGTTAPKLSADELHPVIWNAARGLWQNDHHAEAVQRAATNLSGHVQDLMGRYDMNDVALMNEAFSSADPKPEKPRLRWPGDRNALTVKAMNEGIRGYAAGCFHAIRNPITHSVDSIPRQVALEQLSALSVLARWIDGCEKVQA